ncbi:MAG TPA: single-stranded DNA-binding protein, partial [Candidatus Methanomethylophilaceae archaeon]|nr:single-stranded DNA-binding protein [Candidatus Methanomethylophilaceae archaeon]
LTPHYEELKRVLKDKVDDTELMNELKKYVNEFHVSPEAAKRGILRKHGSLEQTPFQTSVVKKIGDLNGTEQSVDILVRVIYVEEKEITVRGSPKTITSGIIGDESGTASFTIWEKQEITMEKGSVYWFRSAYTKTWNEKVQVNMGARGSVGSAEGMRVDVPDRVISMEASECKIGEITGGMGNVTVTGRILSTEERNITVKGEPKVVYSGMLADDTGKIQYSAWNDLSLKEGETVCVKNAYIRAWKGIPQLNIGDRAEVSRVDDTFGEISDDATVKQIGDIIRTGGGIDINVIGTVVDVRRGSGLIERCPECNRSIMNGECQAHGKVEPVMDLRMKLTLDDGTGAISAIINRDLTEKLTGVTMGAAEGLAKAKGNIELVAQELAKKMIIRRLSLIGNVLSDEYGPMMIVRDADFVKENFTEEAEKLLAKVEESL